MCIENGHITGGSRAQAIEDGVLIDVSKMAREAGFTVPVAVTQAVWAAYIEPDEKSKSTWQDRDGRLWDTLYVLDVVIKHSDPSSSAWEFPVIFVIEGEEKLVILKANIGPGDELEPVLTIVLQNED